MVALDLGEFAYGSGDAVVPSKVVVLAAPGDAADLPRSWDPVACLTQVNKELRQDDTAQINLQLNICRC